MGHELCAVAHRGQLIAVSHELHEAVVGAKNPRNHIHSGIANLGIMIL